MLKYLVLGCLVLSCMLTGTRLAVAAAPKHPVKKTSGTGRSGHTSAPGSSHSHISAGRGSRVSQAKTGLRGRRAKLRGVPFSRHTVQSIATPESRRLNVAFVASAQLRPMAQQLLRTRTPAAYAGVENYAGGHPGDGAAAAQLALGHAFALDRRYAEAEGAFRQAKAGEDVLADYADYLGAQAAVQANRPGDAISLLERFAERHPGSLFTPAAPVLLANAYLAGNDAGNALRVLRPLQSPPDKGGKDVEFRMALAKAYQASGDGAKAAGLYRNVYLNDPLSNEATLAKVQLTTLNLPLTAAERKQHADALFNAKQFSSAALEYRDLQHNETGLSQPDRDALEIYAAVCDLRLKRLSRGDVDHLPVTGDDSAALKLYMRSELARNEGQGVDHDSLVAELTSKYPQSRWLEEALYSGGNMYLLRRDAPHAIAEYTSLFEHFPRSTYAPSAHWRAAWLTYRLRRFPEAAKLMEEQITNYPAGTEIPGALYWRGRLYEDAEKNLAQAVNFYTAVNDAYVNSYYALLGRKRLAVLQSQAAVDPAPALASVRAVEDPHLIDALPENDPHLIKARLLANAGLNEYIRPEIQLSATAGQWGALAEAEIYQSFGEDARALQAMKRSHIPFFSLSVDDVPAQYWQLVFPRPYWATLVSDAQANGLDPYLVASLIRQESEFNPGAVSRANAVGLMQLLPSTGKSLAKRSGNKHFTANELLNPSVNLQLGTLDLRTSIDRYGGQIEYALAAYNAGDGPVRQWIASNDYKDVPEWVESIPYSETRDYVQSIMRNREVYRAVYASHTDQASR